MFCVDECQIQNERNPKQGTVVRLSRRRGATHKYVLRQCGKIYACLRSISLKSYQLKQDTKLKLFKSFILPHFISCDFLLNSVSARTSDRLRIALNSCIRYVYGLHRMDRVTHLQATLLGYSFYNFIKARSCILLHSIITKRCPAYLYSKLQPFRSSRLKAYVIPAHSTAFYGSTFFVRGVALWNSLPNSLKNQQSLIMFKKQCKMYLNQSILKQFLVISLVIFVAFFRFLFIWIVTPSTYHKLLSVVAFKRQLSYAACDCQINK